MRDSQTLDKSKGKHHLSKGSQQQRDTGSPRQKDFVHWSIHLFLQCLFKNWPLCQSDSPDAEKHLTIVTTSRKQCFGKEEENESHKLSVWLRMLILWNKQVAEPPWVVKTFALTKRNMLKEKPFTDASLSWHELSVLSHGGCVASFNKGKGLKKLEHRHAVLSSKLCFLKEVSNK